MNRRYRLASLLASFCASSLAYADEEANVSVYIFGNGKPLPHIELNAGIGHQAVTDGNGYALIKLPSGQHLLRFQQAQQELVSLELPLVDGEDVQVIITTYADGREASVDIETSNEEQKFVQVPGAEKPKVDGKGFISGSVISAESKKPVAGAKIFISGVANELRTGQDGAFSIEVPAGDYSLSIMHPDFSAQVKDGINVAKNDTVTQTFALTPAGFELPEHVVLEPHIAGSLASIVEEQRTTSAVANILGAEQISRSGDSDAAGALRRTTGLTLIGGKFIYVRGLGERYSSTLLNGASIPSPDPTRRVVPLDLFPTTVIDSVMIQKSYSVDRPGEFAGGTVELRTKTVPDEFFTQLSYQLGITEGTTFDDGLRYQGGSTDMFGIDDGTRKMPGSLSAATAGGVQLSPLAPTNPKGFSTGQLQTMGNDLSGVWDINNKPIGPDSRVSLGIGDAFHNGDFTLGYTTSLRWTDGWNSQNEIQRFYAPTTGNKLEMTVDNDVNFTERETNLSGYLGLEARYTDNHRFYGNSLILRQTLDEARITEGWSESEDFVIRRSQLQYMENSLLVGQIGGEHRWDLLANLETNWLWTRSAAGRKAPYERSYRFDQIPGGGGDFFFTRRADSNQVNFSELDDNDQSFRFDAKLPLDIHPDYQLTLQSGFIDQSRTRESEIRRFSFGAQGADSRRQDVLGLGSLEKILSPQFMGANGFQLRETTRATDNYEASQELFSYYGQGDLNLFETVRLTGGLRVEDNNQRVSTFEMFNPNNAPQESKLVKKDLLPSAAATWLINDTQQLRAGYSESISRPDFRELSPAPFLDPASDRETLGNPDLEQAEITSYDLRWEYYFSSNESLTLGAFWKDIANPIELILLPGPGGVLTLQNAKTASVYGFEAEIMKHLDFIHPELENFYVSTNYTWTKSEIELKPENMVAQTTNFRPLQGHSPYVFNFQVGYDNPDNGILATLLYNTYGKRIAEVGSLGAPDKYDQPVHQVDFVYRQKVMDHVSLTLNARNLLDDSVVVLQGDQIARSFRRGREFRLGVVVDF
ncbi:MAG: TonB-dependent receptor domain-containing protein [Methylobacter sp.]